jgi:hypothetical protein
MPRASGNQKSKVAPLFVVFVGKSVQYQMPTTATTRMTPCVRSESRWRSSSKKNPTITPPSSQSRKFLYATNSGWTSRSLPPLPRNFRTPGTCYCGAPFPSIDHEHDLAEHAAVLHVFVRCSNFLQRKSSIHNGLQSSREYVA